MSLAVRVIPCLDVDAGRVVKGVHFENLKDAGDPVALAAEYYRQGADELTFLDVTASSSHRQTMVDVVTRTAEQVFIPLTVGGGVRTPEDVDSLLRCGADKVGVNTAAINDPIDQPSGGTLRQPSARPVGRCAPRTGGVPHPVGLRGHHHGRPQIHRHRCAVVGQARRGIGRRRDPAQFDGRRRHPAGDLERISAMRREVSIPIIASGGAGKAEDFPPAIAAGADAVLAASIFHFGKVTIGEVKSALRAAGYTVR